MSIPHTQLPPKGPTPAGDDDEINIADLLAVILDGRWIILGTLLLCLAVGGLYAWTATPIYRTDALVQVETEAKGLNAALGDMAELLGSETPVTAEIEILKSRMVIGKVVETLGTQIKAQPRYFPFLGRAVARRYRGSAVAAPLLGLDSYAWGGEKIDIATLDVPSALLGAPLQLVAHANRGFSLVGPDGETLLKGEVGKPATAAYRGGALSIFVRELVARPQTEFKVRRIALTSAVQDIAEQLRVSERGKQSGIISVTYQNSDPQLAAQVVDQLVTAYQRQNVERRSAEAEQTLVFLREQLPQLKNKLESAEAALNRYRLQQGSADLTKETELVLQQSVELETQRVTLLQKREEVLRRFTPQHPVVQALDAQLAQIQGQQRDVTNRVKGLPDTQQELLSLARDVEVNTALYTALLNSAQELQVAKAGTVGNVRIIDRPVVPLRPSAPRKPLIVALSIVLGLFLGIVAVFVVRAVRRGVEDPTVIEQQVGLPTYASVPFSREQDRLDRALKRAQKAGPSRGILAVSDPSNLAIESLRSLRTSLHFALMESSNNVLMLTGPSPGLGKSFVSINLGAVLAMAGKRVVVIDGDLRRGHMHEYAGVDRAPGISDYVVGKAELVDIVRFTPVENLAFVPTGTIPPNPAELLLHDRFATLIRQLSEQYDHVLIDTPPILAVTDAAVIGRLAGCALLVLKAGEHPIRTIEESSRRLIQAGVHLRGTIFNQVNRSGSKYYGYKYGYNYSYKSAKA